MTWTQERSTVNQRVQIGAESTSALGTPVAASKLLQCFDWQFGIEGDFDQYTPTGTKYVTIQEQNTEWMSGSLGGKLDYNGVIYPLSSAMGAISPVASGSSSTAKDWIYTPPVSGSIVPQTYSAQQGDSATRAHSTSYLLFQQFGYNFTRKQVGVAGKFIAQAISDGITLTSSPTAIPLAPVASKQFNVYADDTYAGLGTTQITCLLSFDYSMDNLYDVAWYVNRTNPGWTNHVDMKPTTAVKMKVTANAEGAKFISNMRTGATKFVRVEALGTVIDNNQTISLGSPSAGNFTLTYKGQTTANIVYNAAASAVQSALQALSTIGAGNATVSGSNGGPYTVTFAGTLANDMTALTGNGTGLTGGTFAVTQTQIYNAFVHDMALKVGKPSPFEDESGLFAQEWDCVVVADSGWGKAQTIKVTNTLTSL
jgi:hypothetical protein